MNRRELARLDRELREFLDTMTEEMGRPERRAAMRAYVTGLLLDGERKSVEPMAARLVDDEKEIGAMRQRLLGCVAESGWSDAELFRRLARKLDQELPGVEAFVIDDTGFPKKGIHSVGVARQYSGTLGRTDNCQVATSLHLAGESGSGSNGSPMRRAGQKRAFRTPCNFAANGKSLLRRSTPLSPGACADTSCSPMPDTEMRWSSVTGSARAG